MQKYNTCFKNDKTGLELTNAQQDARGLFSIHRHPVLRLVWLSHIQALAERVC